METLDFATIINGLNILLLLALLFVYIKNYLSMRSNFGLGLIFFALLLLIHNIVAVYSQISMIMYYSSEVAGFAFLLNVLQSLALAVLVYITWK